MHYDYKKKGGGLAGGDNQKLIQYIKIACCCHDFNFFSKKLIKFATAIIA